MNHHKSSIIMDNYRSEGFALTGYVVPGSVEDGAWMLWENSSVVAAAVLVRSFLDIFWHSVFSAQHSVLKTQYSVFSIQYLVSSTQYWVLSEHWVLSIGYWVLGITCKIVLLRITRKTCLCSRIGTIWRMGRSSDRPNSSRGDARFCCKLYVC